VFNRDKITYKTSLPALNRMHSIVSSRRKGTEEVRVNAKELFALLQDHAHMSDLLTEEGIQT
jgi:hypothetical protein